MSKRSATMSMKRLSLLISTLISGSSAATATTEVSSVGDAYDAALRQNPPWKARSDHPLSAVWRKIPDMAFIESKTASGVPGAAAPGERDFAAAVKRSETGQLSVSIDDLSKTQSFKRDLDVLKRIRERSQTPVTGR